MTATRAGAAAMKRLLLPLAVLACVGCASERPYIIWSRPGTEPLTFKQDNYACTQESRTSWSGGGSGLIGLSIMASAKANAEETAHHLYVQCMEARGYTGRPATEAERARAREKSP